MCLSLLCVAKWVLFSSDAQHNSTLSPAAASKSSIFPSTKKKTIFFALLTQTFYTSTLWALNVVYHFQAPYCIVLIHTLFGWKWRFNAFGLFRLLLVFSVVVVQMLLLLLRRASDVCCVLFCCASAQFWLLRFILCLCFSLQFLLQMPQ